MNLYQINGQFCVSVFVLKSHSTLMLFGFVISQYHTASMDDDLRKVVDERRHRESGWSRMNNERQWRGRWQRHHCRCSAGGRLLIWSVSNCMDSSILNTAAIKSKQAAASGQKQQAAAESVSFIEHNGAIVCQIFKLERWTYMCNMWNYGEQYCAKWRAIIANKWHNRVQKEEQ